MFSTYIFQMKPYQVHVITCLSSLIIDIKNIPQYEVYLNKRTKRIQIRGVLPLLKSLKKDEEKHKVVFLKKNSNRNMLVKKDFEMEGLKIIMKHLVVGNSNHYTENKKHLLYTQSYTSTQ